MAVTRPARAAIPLLTDAARPVEARRADVVSLRLRDGRALCVRRWPGTGEGTLVLLHGQLDSSEGWERLRDAPMCARIAFDLPGFGCSDAAPRGTIAGYARDIADGLEILGIERFTLVGHSLGGAVATAVAELMPTKAQALVLLAPAGFGRIHLAEAASIPGLRGLIKATLPWTLSSRLVVTAGYGAMVANGNAPDRELVQRLSGGGRALAAAAYEGTRAVVDAGRAQDAFHRRRVRYSGPVVAVWGDRDRLVPCSHQDGVRAAFPQARIEIWKGMGHHAIGERFDELVALIIEAASGGGGAAERMPDLRVDAA
jgi:pimeloyl-ACP methyl ester carboxylesterase